MAFKGLICGLHTGFKIGLLNGIYGVYESVFTPIHAACPEDFLQETDFIALRK